MAKGAKAAEKAAQSGQRPSMKVKKGDTVLVIAGKDKGAKGKVLASYPTRQRIVVEGINRVKKHTRRTATQRGGVAGGIETTEAAIHVSNVMVLDHEGSRTKVGFRKNDDGRNVRVARSSGKDIA
jgi:large subunit ribosomal protein L24